MTQNIKRTRAEAAKLIMRAKHSIGVITPAGAGSYGDILEGIRVGNRNAETGERVVGVVPYYTFNLEEASIKTAVHRALDEEMDVIVTVGATISRVTRQLLAEIAPNTPHICLAVGDPKKTGVYPADEPAPKNMTATNIELCNIRHALSFLTDALPNTKKILFPVPAAPNKWLASYVDEIKQYCSANNLQLHIVEDSSMHALFTKVENALNDVDVLFIPEGNPLLDMHRSLGALCDVKQKPFFSGHEWGARTSTGLAYAMPIGVLGERAYTYAARIIFDGVTPNTLVDESIKDTRRPMVNRTIAALQGVDVPALKERLAGQKDIEFVDEREC